MKQKDILDEEWTPLKIVGLLMCEGVLFIIGHYQYCIGKMAKNIRQDHAKL